MADYWNRLCDRLDQAWQEETRLLGDDYEQLCHRADVLRQRIDEASKALGRLTVAAGEHARVDAPESETRLLGLLRAHREAWRSATALRSARRSEPGIAPHIKVLWDRYERDIRSLGLASGCHESNRANVADSFRLAVRQLGRKGGRPKRKYAGPDNVIDPARINRVALRHRFGSGGLSVPRCFSKASGLFHLAAIPREAYASNSRVARHRRLTNGHLRLPIGPRDQTKSSLDIRFSAMLHRPLPQDGVVKVVQLLGRRSYGVWSWRLNVTVEQPPPSPVSVDEQRAVAGLDLNWRRVTEPGGESAIRFGAVVDSAGERYFLMLPLSGQRARPPHRRRRFTNHAHLSELQRRADELLHATKARLKPLLTAHANLPESVTAWAANLATSGRRGLLTGLSLLERYGVAGEAQTLLKSQWLEEDRRIRMRIARLSDHLTNRRAHLYRNTVLALCRRYRIIAIKGDFAVSRVSRQRRHPTPEDSRHGREESEAPRGSGRYRQYAAVDTFVRYLEEAAGRCRTVIFSGTAAFVTVKHQRCGTVVRRGPEIDLYCETCGMTFDQDLNAAHNLLLQISDAESPTPVI